MADNEFNFYNSENDGYRGGFGDYADPSPAPVPGPVGPGPESPRKRPGRFTKRAIALLLACVVVGGAAGAGGAAAYQQITKPDTVVYQGERPTVDVDTVANSNDGQPMTPEQLYAANLASCVGITVSTTSVNIFGQTTTSAASGSGFVLTQDGYIVTNYHVIEDAVDDSSVSIEVSFADGTQYTATLVGGEQDNDVAVLKIDASGLTPAQFGDDTLLRSGDPVSAIGNHMGYRSTITPGIVSALDQPVSVEGTTMYLLQTSAAINYGSSGGALLNDRGQVVGVTTIKIVADDGSAEGLGFAIPTTRVKQVVDRLIAGAPVTRPSLGIIVRRGQGENGGLVVEEVDPDSDCHLQGIQPQDIIVAANGQQVQTFADLERIKRTLDVGDSLLLEVLRGGEHLEFTVTLMDQDDF